MALIALDDLHFAYPGQEPVLRGATLRLGAGQRLSLVGPNGAGKSTLLRMIVGLQHPDRGTVTVGGLPRRREADFREVRQRVGLLFQDPDDQLFCPTVAEDVAFGPLNLGQSRQEALETVGAVLDELGILHLRDRPTHRLSGGEKRLVALATVLAMRPEALLLDEPANALDPANEARLVAVLDRLPQAMLLVTHSPQLRARIAPGAVALEGGRIVAAT